MCGRRKIGGLICIDLKTSAEFTGSRTTISTDFLNIMPIWIEWAVVFDTVSARFIKGPVSYHVGILGDFLFDVSNRHSTRSSSQTIGVGSSIGSEGNGYATWPWIAPYLECVVSIGYLRKTSTNDLTIGYCKIRFSETGNCTRCNCGSLAELKVYGLRVFTGY